MKVSVRWFLALCVVLAAMLVFQTSLHSQSPAGTIKWASSSSGCSNFTSCTVTMSWSPSAFASGTNYVATCTPTSASSNASLSIISQTTSQIEVELQDATESSQDVNMSGVGCIAVATN